LKMALDVKDGSGHMPCLKCRNLVSKTAWQTVQHTGGALVPIHELDINKFEEHTDSSFVNNMKHLQSQQPLLSSRDFDKLETSLGLILHLKASYCVPTLSSRSVMLGSIISMST
jgi:hypothetical protein